MGCRPMASEIDGPMLADIIVGCQIGANASTTTASDDLEQWIIDVVRDHGPVSLVPPDEVGLVFPEDALGCCIGAVGSLLALQEMPPTGHESVQVMQAMTKALERPISAIAPLNGRGINCLLSIAAAAMLHLPLIDCDGQGRVLPRIDQTTYALSGLPLTPMAAVGPWGDVLTIDSPHDRAEPALRSALGGLGGWVLAALYPAPLTHLAASGIPHAVSAGATAGAILRSGRGQESMRIAGQLGGRLVGRRILTAMEHRHRDRPSPAMQPGEPMTLLLESADPKEPMVLLEVRNEIVLALVDGSVVGSAPDVIALIDPLRQASVDLSDLRVGDVVDILVFPADPLWYSAQGLRLSGPQAFGVPHQRRAK